MVFRLTLPTQERNLSSDKKEYILNTGKKNQYQRDFWLYWRKWAGKPHSLQGRLEDQWSSSFFLLPSIKTIVLSLNQCQAHSQGEMDQLRPFSKGFSHILKEWRSFTEKDREYVAYIPVFQPRLPRTGEGYKQTQVNIGSDIKTDTVHTLFAL